MYVREVDCCDTALAFSGIGNSVSVASASSRVMREVSTSLSSTWTNRRRACSGRRIGS